MQEPRTRPATAATMRIAHRVCIWCYGTGRVPIDYHQSYVECDVCGGSGIRPNQHLHDAPAAPMVAAAA
jgi:hypothetical protein